MKIFAHRPTHISAVATVPLITKTFIVKYYDIRTQTNTTNTDTEKSAFVCECEWASVSARLRVCELACMRVPYYHVIAQ